MAGPVASFKRNIVLVFVCAVALSLSLPVMGRAESADRTIDVVQLRGLIDPTTASYLRAKLDEARTDASRAVIVQVNSEGGVHLSIQELTDAIFDSSVPVIVWVAPRGARAASTATLMVYAGDLAFMAASTRIGPAAPVTLAGEDRGSVTVAARFIERLARDGAQSPRAAVVADRSIAASEAVSMGVVDGVASTLRELLQAIDGKDVPVGGGASTTLETWDDAEGAPSVNLRFRQMDPLEQLLHTVTDPSIAYILLLLGMFGLIFEVYNPGIGLAAALGGIALLLAFYALSVLPANWIGVLVTVVGVAALVVDLHTGRLGAWTVGGLASVAAGGQVLFLRAPVLRLSVWTILVGIGLTLLFFISVMTAALRVRLRRPVDEEDALVGAVAVAQTDIAPEGTVVTKGTSWRARTMETGIAAGSAVKVKATEGVVLLVEPMHETSPSEPEDTSGGDL